MAYTDPGYYVEREIIVPSVSLTTTNTPLKYVFGRKVTLTSIQATVTTAVTGTPVVKAQVGAVDKATVSPVGAAADLVAGTVTANNEVAADDELAVNVTTAGTAGVANIVIRYKEKF